MRFSSQKICPAWDGAMGVDGQNNELPDILYIIWKGMIYANYDYIRNVLITSIYTWLFEKRVFLATFSSFNNLYNARVKVNETALYCSPSWGYKVLPFKFIAFSLSTYPPPPPNNIGWGGHKY